MIKPLYGFLTDSFPLFGYRRRSYLVCCGLLGACSLAVLAALVDSPAGATAALMTAALATAFSDVVTDAIAVERSRGQPQATAGSLQSLCWGSHALGGVLVAYFSGSLVERYGTRVVFGITAVFPLLVTLTALLIDEASVHRMPALEGGTESSATRRQQQSYSLVDTDVIINGQEDGGRDLQISALEMTAARPSTSKLYSPAQPLHRRLAAFFWSLWQAITTPRILLPTVFIFFSSATPTYGMAMFYFETNVLGFTPHFLG